MPGGQCFPVAHYFAQQSRDRRGAMNDKSGIDWDDAFANGAYIENSMSYPPL